MIAEKTEKMKFLKSDCDTKSLEKDVKNKWNSEWLSECDKNGNRWEIWLRKPDIPGAAYCECCVKTIINIQYHVLNNLKFVS